jgi:hypothetical protein
MYDKESRGKSLEIENHNIVICHYGDGYGRYMYNWKIHIKFIACVSGLKGDTWNKKLWKLK